MCPQKQKTKIQKLVKFRDLLEMTFQYLLLKLQYFTTKLLNTLIYATFLLWFSIYYYTDITNKKFGLFYSIQYTSRLKFHQNKNMKTSAGLNNKEGYNCNRQL